MINTFEELRKTIELSNSIAISGHTSPDGDAVGASVALAKSLRLLGKDVKVIVDEYPEVFSFFEREDFMLYEAEEGYLPDLYITVDCGDKARLGHNANLFDQALYTINIDHHVKNTCFGKQNYVDEEASSTCEIIFQFLYGYAPIDADVAKALYAGIVFDTGGFRHTSTSPVTMAIVSAIMEYDFDFSGIYNSIFHTRSLNEAKIMGVALSRLSSHFNNVCVSTYVKKEDMEPLGVTSDDISEISSYIKGIRNAKVSVFIYEKDEDMFKVSMRSDEPIDVALVARTFGGGGHLRAAGYTQKGDIHEVLKEVLLEIEKQL